MRAVIYVEAVYRRAGDTVYGDYAFTDFLAALAPAMDVRIVGRLDPASGPTRYPLPPEVEFVALPFYPSLTHFGTALTAFARSLRRFWRALDDADVVWLFGPYLLAQLFVLLAWLRGRRVVLGVRQDFPRYVRLRRPGRKGMHAAADGLEWGWRRLARRFATIVVGPELAATYRRAPRLLQIAVSLVGDADVSAGRRRAPADWAGERRVLSVGRLDEEKNPLLLADVLAGLRRRDARWRLVVCGEGALQTRLAERLRELGVDDACELRGHVGRQEGLLELYRSSHALLHVSWTEGFPQVLVEAFASGTPVVATAVGGVAAAAGEAAVLIGPGDAGAAVTALEGLATDPSRRERLVRAGLELAQQHTIEGEIGRVAAFLR